MKLFYKISRYWTKVRLQSIRVFYLHHMCGYLI